MTVNQKLYHIDYYNNRDLKAVRPDLNDLIQEKIHGIVVSDFLSTHEVGLILQGFRNLNDQELVHIQKDFDSYPISFAQFEQMLNAGKMSEANYLAMSSDFISGFLQRFGVDVFEKLNRVFGSFQNAPALHHAPVAGQPSVPFTFRELFAGEGCLKAHCENLFFHEFPGLLQRITQFGIAQHQLSFFIVLQKAGSGGELTLFDILWNEEQKRLGDDHIRLQNSTELAFDDAEKLHRQSLHLNAGSLLVFSGGKIWHRVEKVRSAPSRITLGGFLSFSENFKNLYAWS